MPRRPDLDSICLIGSGPIVIGQACEFDYAGSQALKVLREDGFSTIVINSNPATIMTDPGFADRTYVEPLDLDGIAGVLERERPDALLPTMGGQTALNLALQLGEEGILDELGVELIGAGLEAIRRAEDRELFRETVWSTGLRVPESTIVTSLDEIPSDLTFPVILRPAFTLGGHGGGTARSEAELHRLLERALRESPVGQVLVEESLLGWDEFELEVMRDRLDNVVVVCSIENLDPMGVHTGDSVTVAPQMTLADEEYQELRDAAAAVIRAVGVETGGSNIQFARDRSSGDLRVIEMNPRVSRSSALASKATGYPIAKVAAKLAVGYTLDEIPNDLTKTTPASFEPTLDYVVVKFPRFAFEKFPGADTTLGTQMKSVGEAMGIGRSFLEAFLKAMRSRELDDGASTAWRDLDDLPPGLHPWFLAELQRAHSALRLKTQIDDLVSDDWLRLKRLGLSDADVAAACGTTEEVARARRRAWGVRPAYRRVDSCAGEVEAGSNYFYSAWGEADEVGEPGRSVVILGSGPNRIGQGIEFDYCCVHAARSFRELGYEAVMVNCNPETVSTDYDTSDRLYFEPLGVEEVLAICERERPEGVVIQFGGQTPLKLARDIERAGWRILGTPYEAIDLAEDRERFAALLERLGIRCPEWGIVESAEEAVAVADRVGYPVLVRPSYVLGGRAMRVCYRPGDVEAAMEQAHGRVLVDRFLENAVEIDVDALSDGEETYVAAVMQHVEEAGVHSGDSACVLPPPSLGAAESAEIDEVVRRLGQALGQPPRLTHHSVREQGDRREPRRGRMPARSGRDARRSAATRRPVPPPGARLRQGCGAALRAVPRKRPCARPGDALDRRSNGDGRRLPDRLRQGGARRGPSASDRGHRVPVRPGRRQAGSGSGRSRAGRSRLPAARDGWDGESPGGGRARRRAGPQGVRAGRELDGRRPDPARPLRSGREHASGLGGAHGRVSDPGGGARRTSPLYYDSVRSSGGGARDRQRPQRERPLIAGATRCRGANRLVGTEEPMVPP